jgi:hypothetical protein
MIMTHVNAPADLSDNEADQLWTKLNEIIKLSDTIAGDEGNALGHRIYRLARDCRDLLVFDQQSREVMRKLTQQETYAGVVLTDTVKALAKTGRKLEAIKELRTQTGCGIKEGKDAVEAYMTQQGIGAW